MGQTLAAPWRAVRHGLPFHLGLSRREAEALVHKTQLSRRVGFEHEALPLADHPHDLEALSA